MTRRIASLWFEHLALERVLRQYAPRQNADQSVSGQNPIEGPFAITLHEKNAERIYALNDEARKFGLIIGMGLGDARGLCARLQTVPAQPEKDRRFLFWLARLGQNYCPWVGIDGNDGLMLDITGSAHLWGGENGFIAKAKHDFSLLGLSVKIGIAPTKGAAWALAHYGETVTHDARAALQDLPLAALRISQKNEVLARRLGLHKIGDLYDKPRAEMTRRFGLDFILRLDQALGEQFENLSPIAPPRIFAVRLNLPEPIGLLGDVIAGIARLLETLQKKLALHGQAMQALKLGLRGVDGSWQNLRIGFARPMKGEPDMLPLIEPKIAELDAGFGFDLLRVEAEALCHISDAQQMADHQAHGFHDLLSKIGNRIGFENIHKLSGQESHIPEKSVVFQSYHQPISPLPLLNNPRPLMIFSPERLNFLGNNLPNYFTWRRMKFRVKTAIGPERIAPEWWCEHEGWRFGVRDYWRVATMEGRRLWLFYTPQNPAWYVQGEFG